MQRPGINIWSGSQDPLGAALTNPTTLSKQKGKISGIYPVIYKDLPFEDAEAAYKHFKTGDIDKDMELMTDVIAHKLWQNEKLLLAINKQFEQDNIEYCEKAFNWLKQCRHKVGVHGSRWEGNGTKSRFIWCLCRAYLRVTDPYLRIKWGLEEANK